MVNEICNYRENVDGKILCTYKGPSDKSRLNPLQLGIAQGRRLCSADTGAKQVKCLLNLVQFDPKA